MAAVAPGPGPGPTRVDEWVTPVTTGLFKFFDLDGESFAKFASLLQANNALIAGGSILQYITGRTWWGDKSDIDIYVPAKNIKTFLSGFLQISSNASFRNGIFTPDEFTTVEASQYCRSFLRRNGIRKIYTFLKKEPGDEYSYYGNKNVDVMAVRNKRTPLAVVQNFDLTFCQVWFDGVSVYATHPDHIRTRSGILQGDYVTTLLQGNKFLQRRMKKYTRRGFTIALDPAAPQSVSTSDLVTAMISRPKCFANELTPEYFQRWFNHRILDYLLFVNNEYRTYTYKGKKYFEVPGGGDGSDASQE